MPSGHGARVRNHIQAGINVAIKRKTGSSDLASLPSRGELPLSEYPRKAPRVSPDDARALISELEIQNQELREKQQEIEEARKRYLDLYDFAPIGLFVFDKKGTIIDVNLTGTRLIGLPKNQLVGTPFALFIAREVTHQFYEHLKRVFSGNGKETCELRISQRYERTVSYVSIESAAFDPATCRSAVIDITKGKLAEKELLDTRRELLERNAQLRRHSARLLETQEEERSRVAGDVHDSFASLLCAIKNELQYLSAKGGDDRLGRVLNQLDIGIRDATRIQMALKPPALDDLGLFPALTALCREFQKSHSNIHVEKKFLLAEGKIPDSIEVPIYRIVEEAFKNIASHSGADSVNISLNRKDSFIQLVIQDNGRGFNVEEKLTGGTGRGLSTLRERAVLTGGLFHIESAAGKGTTLRVLWPFA
jgi:PAS domain S-box-containing protein